ncbi:MBL fold metallo-hydrolase [Thiovibrio frasassiensis]|uniref:MBL fold metallo-hydrolase n=1 Tax=Thiovibrio frasassiensis TaxID=2984131 RepID=A0A9X4MIJ5_9BACT|nr:MBL fold metallo-hydrolase [Thiovibrio frasassiensis]MDG4475519.1 MBL fold metallo-hydrolase [Thiovibrio frasassiensis]
MSHGFSLGAFTVHWLQGGEFEIDGGSMFGVVPRLLWEKKCASTEDNYVHLADSPMLVQTPHGMVLIETGLGNKLTPKQKAIFRLRREWDVLGGLARLGMSREAITHVVLTHGDFDHAGGVTMLNGSGGLELTFPAAMHYLQRREWEDVLAPNKRSASAYWPENFSGLVEGKNLRLIDGEEEILPGVRLVRTGGHTRGHQAVWLESGGESALHLGDLLPMPAYGNPLWITAYDNFPLDSVVAKEQFLEEALGKDAWFLFYHDPEILACKLDGDGAVRETLCADDD